MESRKNISFTEERNDRREQPGLSNETSRINDEDNLDTRNVAHNIEEGDEDYDDEELKESDFDIDDEEDDDDFDDEEV
jgi:hypothetical protein